MSSRSPDCWSAEANGDEREQHQDRDGRMQLTTHVLLDAVRLESKAFTVHTNVEITIPVEVVLLINPEDNF